MEEQIKIKADIPQKPPFRYIDSISKLDTPEQYIHGLVQYPGQCERYSPLDNVPYFLILESLAQLSGMLGRVSLNNGSGGYLVSIDKCMSAIRIPTPAVISLQSTATNINYPFCTFKASAEAFERRICYATLTIKMGS